MIIDCHGHYTTVPAESEKYRENQLRDVAEGREPSKTKRLKEGGTDKVFFPPRASAMAHQLGNETAGHYWGGHWNDMIYRIAQMYPQYFVPVGMLPQFPGVSPSNC